MKITKAETQKRLQFLKDFFSGDPDASCRSAQRSLKKAFGQEMRPAVVTAVKKSVIDAQNAAIESLKLPSSVRMSDPGLTPGDNTAIVAPTGCGGDCSKCDCGGK